MKALLMGHLKRTENAFIPYDPNQFRHKGVLFGLWAWRNILEMDTYYGPICGKLPYNLPTEDMKSFLENYDLVLAVGWKEGNYVKNDPDGYNRPAWLKKIAPHLKVALTADFGSSIYETRILDHARERYDMLREQMLSADVFLQLCWAYIEELKEFWKVEHIHTVLPVDFDEYQYQFSKSKLRTNERKRNLIAVTRHHEKSHPNLREVIKVAKMIKQANKNIRFKFFSISQPKHISNPSIIKDHWLDYGVDWYFFDEILPFMFTTEYFAHLSECGIFIDNISVCGAGPRFFINAAALGIPSIINTGLGHALMPELATRRVAHRGQIPDYKAFVKNTLRLINDDEWYHQMSDLIYKRLWDRCRGESAKRQLLQLVGMK